VGLPDHPVVRGASPGSSFVSGNFTSSSDWTIVRCPEPDHDDNGAFGNTIAGATACRLIWTIAQK
jgi:hypothetical protein